MPITRIAYRFRGFLISPPFTFALICSEFETELDCLIWPLGVSIFILGLFLRIWAQQHLHYRLKMKKDLVTTGSYSFLGNPIYLGNILICLGSVVTSELLWFAPIALFYCFSIYSFVVRYEERHLLEKYGESYQKYMSEVPKWFPRTIRFNNLGIKNEYFHASIIAEIHTIFALFPFFAKEIISNIT